MARLFDLAKLFDKRPIWHGQPTPYRTWKTELAAIAARRKGSAYFTWSADYLRTREVHELVAEVHAHGLALVLDADSRAPGAFRVFVLHASETWRVPAMRALDEAMRYGWSEAVEAARSAIIGYTPAQIRDWMTWVRQRDAGAGVTIYALVDRDRERAIRRLGRRCLGEPGSIAGMTLVVAETAVNPRAHALVPRDHRFARFAVDGRWAMRVLFQRRLTVTVTPAVAKRINDFIRSDIQFLGARGWR